jgi:phosphoserine phosphatase
MKLAIFELDRGLSSSQAQKKFVIYLLKNRYIGLLDFLKVAFGHLFYILGIKKDYRTVIEGFIKAFKGLTPDQAQKIIFDFYKKDLSLMINIKLLEKLRYHQRDHDRVVLLSSYIKPLADIVALDLLIDDVMATDLEIKDGVYTGRINGLIMGGPTKLEALRKRFGLQELSDGCIYASRNSKSSLLDMVKNKYLV